MAEKEAYARVKIDKMLTDCGWRLMITVMQERTLCWNRGIAKAALQNLLIICC